MVFFSFRNLYTNKNLVLCKNTTKIPKRKKVNKQNPTALFIQNQKTSEKIMQMTILSKFKKKIVLKNTNNQCWATV